MCHGTSKMSSAKPFVPLTTRQLRCSWCCLCLPLLAVVTVAREEDGHLPGKDDDIDPRVFEVRITGVRSSPSQIVIGQLSARLPHYPAALSTPCAPIPSTKSFT